MRELVGTLHLISSKKSGTIQLWMLKKIYNTIVIGQGYDKNDNWINCNATLDLKQKNISVISDT